MGWAPCQLEEEGRICVMTLGPVKLETIVSHMRAIDRVARFIDTHLDAELSVDVLARVASLSKFHFHQVLRAHTGLTPIQLVTHARLDHAARRLKNTRPGSLKIIDLALDVGFQNASAFTRSFHKRFGASPAGLTRIASSEIPWLNLKWTPKGPTHAPARIVELDPRYFYGQVAAGGRNRTFANEAPEVFESVFDVVKRYGVTEARRSVAFPVGSAWAPVGRKLLMCAFSSRTRLSLPHLEETYMPGGRYICLRHVGPYESRWQAWTKLATLRQNRGGGVDGRRPFEVEQTNHADPSAIPQATVFFPL